MSVIVPLNPLDDADAWDVLFVGATLTPGVIKSISGCGIAYKWDKKRGKGAQGATLTYTGEDPPTLTVVISIGYYRHDPAEIRQQWADLSAFIEELRYDGTKQNVQAVDASHPALAMVGITSVVCESIGAPERVRDGDSEYTVKFQFTPYKPPPKTSATSSPTTSEPQTAKGAEQAAANAGDAPKSAADAQQDEISRLLAQAEAP